MVDIRWIYNYGFFGTRIFDLPSFLICVLFILIAGYKYRVPTNYLLILLLHCLLPFLLNGVLFEPTYMPDQFTYWSNVNQIKSGNLSFLKAITDDGNVLQASAMLSILPFPAPASVASLGFYNTFIYIGLFFILFNKKVFNRVSLIFYLLYPSVALYSALSLRDTLILFFMTLAVLYTRESKIIKSILCLTPIYLIKFQNFFIIAPIILLYYLFKVARDGMSLFKALTIIIISLIGLILSAPIAIPRINFFRGAMYREDGGKGEVELISGIGQFITEGLTSGIYFLAKPFFWEAQGLFPLIQSFENTIVLAIIFLITRQAWKNAPDRLAFWLLFLAFSMSIYGLVVFNYGTAARYRYPFIMIYVLFVCADCNIQKLLPKTNKKDL